MEVTGIVAAAGRCRHACIPWLPALQNCMHIQLGIPTSLRNKPPSAGKTVHALNRRSLLKRKRRNLDESRTSRVHSFDVFDTCLVRVFLRPRDLFLELSARVLK